MPYYFELSNIPYGYKHPKGAFKFALDCVLTYNRIEELSWLTTDGHRVGGVEGDPGWEIERRDSSSPIDEPGYEAWPAWASFRAYVPQEECYLAHPELFMSGVYFYGRVCSALERYVRAGGAEMELAKALLARLHEDESRWSLGRPPYVHEAAKPIVVSKMKVVNICWLSEAACEAEVELSDGEVSCVAFSQPCQARVGDEVTEPLHVFSIRHAMLSDQRQVVIKKVADSELMQNVVARVLDAAKQILAVGGLTLIVEDYLPGGLQNGDMIQFECARIDLW